MDLIAIDASYIIEEAPYTMSELVYAHIAFGTIAVLLGAVALCAPKGAVIHVAGGRGFVLAMTASSLLGAALGLAKHDTLLITFFAGILGAYLVLSGWMAARGPVRPSAPTFIALALVNLTNLAALFTIGYLALQSGDGLFRGYPAEDYVFLGGMAFVAALADTSLVFRRDLSDRHRIARHIWRMCLGFFIAAGSAFTGPGMTAFPEALQQSGLLSLPELAIGLAMVFFLARRLLSRRFADSGAAA